MPRTPLITKVRMAAERLDRPRERSGVEPNRHVHGQPSSRLWQWSILIVGILALLGLAGWQSVEHLWGMQHGARYRLVKVERSAITAYISATGTLTPVIMVQVGTQVSGMIEKLFADFHSTVVPGQQLAQLDQASFRAKVLQAEANRDNARAEVKNAMANVHNVRASIDTARADMASQSAQRERARVAIVDTKRILERQQALFARGLVPRNDVETAQTAYDTAVAQHNAAQADPKVWTLTSEGTLWPIAVRLGINDDQFSELQDGSLPEGQELITGLNDNDGQRASGVPSSSASRPPPVRF